MFGILASSTNTGSISELIATFVAPIAIINNAPSFSQDSMSLKRTTSSQGVQRWELSASLAPTVGDAEQMLHSVNYGHHGVFPVRMPQVAKLECTKAAITVNGNFAAGSDLINITGATKLVKGEFINIGLDKKVYLVKSPGSAGIGVQVYPPLRKTTVNGATINTDKRVTLYVRYNSDVQLGITYVDGILADPGTVSLIEAIINA